MDFFEYFFDSNTPRTVDTTLPYFVFTRTNSNNVSVRFYPGEGTSLSFSNLGQDTLEIPLAPPGFFSVRDKIAVGFVPAGRDAPVCVFEGVVWRIARHERKGRDAYESLVVFGKIWAGLSNLVYRQPTGTATGKKYSSHVVLNASQSGSKQNIRTTLLQIANYAKAGGVMDNAQTVDVSNDFAAMNLPFDECRDITCADALRRLLRFYPRAQAYVDYQNADANGPVLRITKGTDSNQIVGDYSRIISSDTVSQAYPVSRVDLEIETVNSGGKRTISHQKYPVVSGDSDAPELSSLYASLRLAGAEASSTVSRFKASGEARPADPADKAFWRAKHPRLNGIPDANITIQNATCSDNGQLPYFTASGQKELEDFGLHCAVVQYTCGCVIDLPYVKETLVLSMQFLATDAEPGHTYSHVVASSATTPETAPDNLARTIYDDRSKTALSEDIVIALKNNFPSFSWHRRDLPLQSFEVDCSSLTATLHFGAPQHLSVGDLASLLSGFRNKARTVTLASIDSGDPADDGAKNFTYKIGGVPPLASTEWQPGSTQKFKLFSGAVASPNTSTIELRVPDQGESYGSVAIDTSALSSEESIAIHNLYLSSDSSTPIAKILATKDIVINVSGSGDGAWDPSALANNTFVTSLLMRDGKLVAPRVRVGIGVNNTLTVENATDSSIDTTPYSEL